MTEKNIQGLKKGCGKNFFVGMSEIGVIEFECGKWKDLPTKTLFSKMLWCPLCAEKIIEEQDKIIEKLKQEARHSSQS